MRKVSLFLGLALFALAGSARAQEESAPAGAPPALDGNGAPMAGPEAAPVSAPVAAAAPDSKMQVGLNLLPMALGKVTGADANGGSSSMDLGFAYGVGLSFGYAVIPGLTVGLAPQAVLHVIPKDATGTASKEFDIMARVAYAYTVAPKFAIYAEVLPGYSIITNPSPFNAGKGLVLAGGVGATMDVTDQVFVNLGVGYQMGFQKISQGGATADEKSKFLRVALGAGVKL
jgi:opacity protein-like surface antigen